MYQRGETLEIIIEKIGLMYRHKRQAYIFKRPVEKKFVGGKVQYMQKAGVDFNGFICGSGQFVAFEAKQITTKTVKNFDLRLLQQHQWEELKYVHDNGGISFLLIHYFDQTRNEFFRVPVDYIERQLTGFEARQKKNGKRSRIVYECRGSLKYDEMKELNFLLEKNHNNVYVDILGGYIL